MKTRIICLAMAFVMCLTTVCAAQAEFSQTDFDKSGAQSLDMLTTLGILSEDYNKNTNDEVSRAEYVAMLLCITNDDANKPAYSGKIFGDVSSGTKYADSIAAAYNLGFISRADNFRPNDAVTLAEAVTFTVKALGYEPYARNKGGYPSGYAVAADRIGLLENIDDDFSATLGAGKAYILLQNALEADIMEITSYGDRVEMRAESGKNLLSQRFSVNTAEAIVDANSRTDLFSADSALKDGQIMAGGVIYSGAAKQWEDYLGRSVKIYYTEKGGANTIGYMCPTDGDNRIMRIPSDDFDSLDGSTIKYHDGTKIRSVTLADNATLIFNGKMAPLTENRLLSEFGYIELISNDADDKYEVVVAMQYTPYVVSAASAHGIAGTKDGISLKFDTSDSDWISIIKKDGEYISCADISSGDVLMYAESQTGKKTVKTALVNSNSANGVIEAIDEADDTVTVDGRTIKCSESVMDRVRLGAIATLYIDSFGKAVECAVASDRVYGYLNGMKKDVFGTHSVRIFTENNRWVTLGFAKTVKVNDKPMSEDETAAFLGTDESEYRQLIRYAVDAEARITVIDTAAEFESGSSEEEAAIDTDVFRISASAREQYRNTVNSFNGSVSINDGAKLFVVPAQGSGTDEDGFDVLSRSNLTNDATYTYTAYDADKLRCASIFVLSNYQRSYEDDALIVFKGAVRTLNSDGMAVPGVSGWYNGTRLSVPVELISSSAVSRVDELHPGDIFRFSVGKNSSIEKISRVYTQGTPHYLSGNLWSSSGYMSGVVKQIDVAGGKALIEYNNSGACAVYSLGTVAEVGVYEKNSNSFYYGTLADISVGDQLAASVSYLKFKSIYIIRD